MSKSCEQKNIIEHIREKESIDDWGGILKLCEHASQRRCVETKDDYTQESIIASDGTQDLQTAQVKALVELGLLDSAFNQMNGILSTIRNHDGTLKKSKEISIIPFAVQASWRLAAGGFLMTLSIH